MPESILDTTKQALGISDEDTSFDSDLVMHINSVFGTLHQLGIGPDVGFEIGSSSATWDQVLQDERRLNGVKSYMYLKVRMLFDPPDTAFVLAALERMLTEMEWRLMAAQDEIINPYTPTLDDESILDLDGGLP